MNEKLVESQECAVSLRNLTTRRLRVFVVGAAEGVGQTNFIFSFDFINQINFVKS